MFGFQKKQKLSFSELETAQEEMTELRRENANLRERLQQANAILNYIDKVTLDSKVVVDFDNVTIGSIERIKNKHGVPVTQLEIRKLAGECGTWYFYCSEERHQELCDEYKEWKKEKKSND